MLSSEGWRPGRLVPLNSLLGATNELQRENGYVFDIYSLHDGGDAKYQFPGTLKIALSDLSPTRKGSPPTKITRTFSM